MNIVLNGDISKTASIGLSYINVDKIYMGENSKIGHLNIIRGLSELYLDNHATIVNGNKITAVPKHNTNHFPSEKHRHPALVLEKHSAIVCDHFFDCNNTITIGQFTTIAGRGSAFWTHSINLKSNKQETAPITLGCYTMIAANCNILKGVNFPDYSVLAAGSTLHKNHNETYTLYSGVPALAVKKLDANDGYFNRKQGYID